MRPTEATTPSQRVEHLRCPLAQDERKQSPTQQRELPRDRSHTRPQDQADQKNHPNNEQEGVKLFHDWRRLEVLLGECRFLLADTESEAVPLESARFGQGVQSQLSERARAEAFWIS